MNRRTFLAASTLAAVRMGMRGERWPELGTLLERVRDRRAADVTLRIAPVSLELAPGRTVRTIGYNGASPGPLLRVPEGAEITVDVINELDYPELVHWHGQFVSPAVDGASEEGTPPVPAHGHRRYTFTARPAGTRWYHTHAHAGAHRDRSLYSGQFGFFYIAPATLRRRARLGGTITNISSRSVNGTRSSRAWRTKRRTPLGAPVRSASRRKMTGRRTGSRSPIGTSPSTTGR